jgi:hypothetical protein
MADRKHGGPTGAGVPDCPGRVDPLVVQVRPHRGRAEEPCMPDPVSSADGTAIVRFEALVPVLEPFLSA